LQLLWILSQWFSHWAPNISIGLSAFPGRCKSLIEKILILSCLLVLFRPFFHNLFIDLLRCFFSIGYMELYIMSLALLVILLKRRCFFPIFLKSGHYSLFIVVIPLNQVNIAFRTF